MSYIDGFVLPIPKGKVEEYKKMASEAGKIWMKHGAVHYVECVGEDLSPDMKGMAYTKFPELAKTTAEEAIIFAYIVFTSKEHRDEVNANVMAEMEKSQDKFKDMAMPFDMKRMAYGGFEAIVEY